MREFDLNIEKVLENWSVAHALREVIANALDEQIVTHTNEIEIYFDETNDLHIRDYGRGLQYIHLTQNENEEKLHHPNLIGKFGVGLKDALATFDRNEKGVRIISRYGIITMGKSRKHGFDDIITLHAYIDEFADKNFIGTEFIICDCSALDIEEAKSMFLKFSNSEMLEITQYGEVFENASGVASIYINGVKVAQEDNFLFSYNITSLTSAIKKALNRERSNVGRTAYSDRIKAILLHVEEESVIEKLVANLNQYSTGAIADELKWTDISAYAVMKLNSRDDVVFITPKEIENAPSNYVDIVKNSGKEVIFIPETVKDKIVTMVDDDGDKVATFSTVINDFNNSFEYKFVNFKDLSVKEQDIFNISKYIVSFYSADHFIDKIYISETLREDNYFSETVGVWDASIGKIVIKRCQLQSISKFAGTLMHELVHAHKGWHDLERDFENELTNIIGVLLTVIYSKKLSLEDNRVELVID